MSLVGSYFSGPLYFMGPQLHIQSILDQNIVAYLQSF